MSDSTTRKDSGELSLDQAFRMIEAKVEIIKEAASKPLRWFIEYDGFTASQNPEQHGAADADGHILNWQYVQSARRTDWPVRVQIAPGADKETVLALLDKIRAAFASEDWDVSKLHSTTEIHGSAVACLKVLEMALEERKREMGIGQRHVPSADVPF